MTAQQLRCGRRALRFGHRTLVMGVVNVTPDSFSGDGLLTGPGWLERVVQVGRRMVEDGADLLDVGGESSRPGAAPVPLEEELRRVVPAVEALRRVVDVPISVDTTKAEVARQALRAGADMVNDISALRHDPDMVRVVADSGCGVVLMHMKGTPQDMQRDPRYEDVVAEVRDFLAERVEWAERHGIPRDRILVDPGFGFGKRPEHNLELVRNLRAFRELGCPVLLGPSRKSTIGVILGGLPPAERVEGTAAVVALAVACGVDVVRVHDVRAMARVVRVADAVVRGWAPDR
ncbi:MAG: dihydropteroate synthase [Armatimonadota bacterium]|nr:dihydropteroate synthase [Armatimonadota bacterium]MDR5675990.1 dihydropteroate synthase [Armatimonadota bacterium]MDR5689265.1 dihydropteroate synthase [Armatimonadota bacterium]MDR7389644.1 dihydropteroate synthase [Armatimonadota bacterium]MDR7390592.1 dihydropteroate synthase [Armatimonadota bacterium]